MFPFYPVRFQSSIIAWRTRHVFNDGEATPIKDLFSTFRGKQKVPIEVGGALRLPEISLNERKLDLLDDQRWTINSLTSRFKILASRPLWEFCVTSNVHNVERFKRDYRNRFLDEQGIISLSNSVLLKEVWSNGT